MQIPTFFLRTTIRLLLFQALIAWFCLRSHNLPLPAGVGFALSTTLGSYVSILKEVLDSRFGFILPWEATFFLPAVLDEYIINSMPHLAVLLGTSPCDHRISKQDPETNICLPELANYCCGYAEMYSHKPKASLQVLEACWNNYHTDAKDAKKHHNSCHRNEPPTLMQLSGCLKAREYWERKSKVCPRTQPIMHCIAEYGAWEAVAPLFERAREKKLADDKMLNDSARLKGEEQATGLEIETETT